MGFGDKFGAGFGGRFGASLGGGADTLLRWVEGAFSNTSQRFLWDDTGGVLWGPFAGGTAAIASIGGKNYYQSENSATNDLDDSEDLTAWASLGSETVGADAGAAPDGNTTADSITFTAAAGDGVSATIAGVADSVNVAAGLWARTTSGTKGFRIQLLLKDGTTATSAEQTATTSWQRFEFMADILAGGTTPEVRILNDAGATAGVALFWGAMADDGGGAGTDYLSSYIVTSGAPATRNTDNLLFSAAQVPTVMREGQWKYSLIMPGASTEDSPAGVNSRDFAWGSGGTRGMLVQRTGSEKSTVFDYRGSTTYVTATNSATWSRHQTVTTKLDTVAGSTETVGATTGDGVTVGTAWSGVIPGTDDLRIGRFWNATTFTRGLISEPEPW